MINGKKDSYDYISEAVTKFWKDSYPQPVIAFFYQKYDYESDDKWEWMSEFVDDFDGRDCENMEFLTDFCEGQTCVKDIQIIPLQAIIEDYEEHHLDRTHTNFWYGNSNRSRCSRCGATNPERVQVCPHCFANMDLDYKFK